MLDSIESNIIKSEINTNNTYKILENTNKKNKTKKQKYILKVIGGVVVIIPITLFPFLSLIISSKILLSSLVATTGVGSLIYLKS